MPKTTKKTTDGATLVERLQTRTRETADDVEARTREAADQLQDAGRNVWLAGLGLFATAGERAGATLDRLADRGKKVRGPRLDRLAEPVRAAGERAQALGQRVERRIENRVASTLSRMGVPSRHEITKLIGQVEALNKKIDRLAAKA